MDRRPRTQVPPVDHTACICRVDGGLKTIAGAKKFVHGGKLCLRPSIKTSIHPTKVVQKSTQRKRSGCGGDCPFIPGLPDDLAIACLIRVPCSQLQKLRVVCRRWCRLLAGTYFYSLRQKFGLTEEWIYIIKRDKVDGRVSWDCFDPVSRIWHPVPPIPTEYSEMVGFGSAVLDGSQLYLFGGNDPVKGGSMRRVIIYNAKTNKWHRAPDMIRRRRFFSSCVINNRLYVAGGVNDNHTLTTAEVYDPGTKRWSFTSNMTTGMAPFGGVVYDGKWYLKGLGPDGRVLSEFYLPEADRWNPVVVNGMISGWRNPCVCFDGRLYDVGCKDGCKFRCYNEETDCWSKDSDSKMHLGSSPLLEAASLLSLNGKICVVRNNMSISLVDVARTGGDGVSREHCWEMIAGRGKDNNFFPNLWTNLFTVRRDRKSVV